MTGSVSTSNKLFGTLGTEGNARVNDASLVHPERRKDNTKAWLEEEVEKAGGKTPGRLRFLDFHQ